MGADKWKLLFNRSLISETDCKGGTCTRSMVAKCQKKQSEGTQLKKRNELAVKK